MSRRIDVEVKDLEFRVLPQMVKIAEELYSVVKEKREAKACEKVVNQGRKRKPQDRLKAREPWW